MRKIDAIISLAQLEAVRESLLAFGFEGLTVTEVFTTGSEAGPQTCYRGQPTSSGLLRRAKIEIIVRDDETDEVVRIISEAARLGPEQGGDVFVYQLSETYRIRNLQQDEAAI